MTYEMTKEVERDDLDELEHVNNVRYVQWIQDISKAHWESRAPESIRKKVIWVVRQHLIQYKNAAKLGDVLQIRTFIEKSEGAISTRVVEMQDLQTGQPIVRSETEWCLLDGQSLRPMRIPEEIRSVFIEDTHP
ncbi:acyl-CoA thioester hydrolase [Muriicola jejuensis]|uniref:Acyl-CoA thioesterase n=1 Tax=Muriicola jejuensis TaxID=504488 RepID=A0A6P0UGW9_9FLAO|nr:acyl-ACP thioesterase domain-containing protein [Muriicola jejuensis]NER11099.1 acyl-CoA thioesterase [Muriicola jejuensis]SMP23726.1 acyl-CoA thioester hydrolase [Muriicola jejuensis]